MDKRYLPIAFSLLLGSSITACANGGGSVPAAVTSATQATSQGGTRAVQAVPTVASVMYIAAGGTTIGRWIGATGFTGGSETSVTANVNTSNVYEPAPQGVYQSNRYAMTSFVQSGLTPNAPYQVRFHYAETYFTAVGQRVFSDSINGVPAETNYDIVGRAGGANIAVADHFTSSADASGKITIRFTASVNNAMISGIQITALSSATPAPTPTPTAEPTSTPTAAPTSTPVSGAGDVMPWVYSELWSTTSPLMHTVASLKTTGATVVAHQYMDALWNQGLADNGPAQNMPIYTAKSTDPVFTTICTQYGGNCDAKNLKVRVPRYAVPQDASDGHLLVIDQTDNLEVDCWQASLSGSTLRCSWAGAYTLGSNGLAHNGSEGVHFGPAASEFLIAPQELVNGHIDHALGLDASCLNSPSLYPADQTTGTDTACSGGGSNPPHYGNLVHLLWTPAQIAGSAYSAPCKVILTALATYGAYLDDTGNNGLQFESDNYLAYVSNPVTASQDPWPGLQAKMTAAGDGSGSGDNGSWRSCLNRVSSGDFEMLEIAQH